MNITTIKTSKRAAFFLCFLLASFASAGELLDALHCNVTKNGIVVLSIEAQGRFTTMARAGHFEIVKDKDGWVLLRLHNPSMLERTDLTNPNMSSMVQMDSKKPLDFTLRTYDLFFLNGKKLKHDEFIKNVFKTPSAPAKALTKKNKSNAPAEPFTRIGSLGGTPIGVINLHNDMFKDALAFFRKNAKDKKTKIKTILRLYFDKDNTIKSEREAALIDALLVARVLKMDRAFFANSNNYLGVDGALKVDGIDGELEKALGDKLGSTLIMLYYTKGQEAQALDVVKKLQKAHAGGILPLHYESR